MRKKILFFLIMYTCVFVFVLKGQEKDETVNLLSLQEGTFPVVVPASYGGWPAEALLDESPTSGWACESEKLKNNVFVFEMVSPAAIERFEFDNASVDEDGSIKRCRFRNHFKNHPGQQDRQSAFQTDKTAGHSLDTFDYS
jgi:hypothetical protein